MRQLFENYLSKHSTETQLIEQYTYAPLTIVIPCYDEIDYIVHTLQSIWENTSYYKDKLHVIVVINQRPDTPEKVLLANKQTEEKLIAFKNNNKSPHFFLSILNITLPKNTMGVGTARKIGMDEAIKQYAFHNKDGILISLDADTLCEKTYLAEIDRHYQNTPSTNSTVINYKHPFETYPSEQSKSIAFYELYLRYMTLSYRYIGHPNAFHTIGSAFTTKASVYCKQGGMNQRQAGEDFYFLQKIFNLGNCFEINTTCIYPSGRFSNRVPFGTGRSIENIINNETNLFVYNFEAFRQIKKLCDIHPSFFKQTKYYCIQIATEHLDEDLTIWLAKNNFFENIDEINNNSASLHIFSRKFFNKFSILQIIRYLNASHTTIYQQQNIIDAIRQSPYSEYCDFSNYKTLLHSLREYYVR